MTVERLSQPAPTASILRPEVHAERVADAIESALAPSTRTAYRGALGRLRRWARREGFREPTHPAALAAYLTELAATGRSASIVATTLAAVRRDAFERGIPDPTGDRSLTLVVEGVRRQIAGEHRVEKAHPLSTPEIARILAAIDQETVAGRRDAFLIAGLLYAGALRRSEAGALTRGDVALGADGIRVTLRRSKTDHFAAGATIGLARGKHPATDPVRLLTRWLAVRGATTPASPLIPRIARSGAIIETPLTGHSIGVIIKTRATAAGLDAERISGHSGRRGHVSTAILAGSDVARIAKTTRHARLDTLLGYADELRVLEHPTSADLGL